MERERERLTHIQTHDGKIYNPSRLQIFPSGLIRRLHIHLRKKYLLTNGQTNVTCCRIKRVKVKVIKTVRM